MASLNNRRSLPIVMNYVRTIANRTLLLPIRNRIWSARTEFLSYEQQRLIDFDILNLILVSISELRRAFYLFFCCNFTIRYSWSRLLIVSLSKTLSIRLLFKPCTFSHQTSDTRHTKEKCQQGVIYNPRQIVAKIEIKLTIWTWGFLNDPSCQLI